MRLLGFDLGTRTLGISLSDETMTIASAYKTIRFDEGNYDVLIPQIKTILDEYNVKTIVLGLPKNMNNTLGFKAQEVQDFVAALTKYEDIKVTWVDERLTTVSAERALLEADVSRKKRKDVIDKMAAVIILQSYLDRF